jgi:hypothetical protein
MVAARRRRAPPVGAAKPKIAAEESMNLGLSEEQELLRTTFAELFAAESSCDRVRAAPELLRDP